MQFRLAERDVYGGLAMNLIARRYDTGDVVELAISGERIMDEDAVIQVYRINVRPADVTVVPVEKVFE